MGVNEGKENGLIVDYCGILRNLRKALAAYGTGNENTHGADPALPNERLVDKLEETIEEVKSYLLKLGFNLELILKTKEVVHY